MSRKAKTKTELMENIYLNRKLLDKKLAKLTPEQLVWPGSMNDWSVKDILGHLIDWEQRFISWYEAGLRGATPETPGHYSPTGRGGYCANAASNEFPS